MGGREEAGLDAGNGGKPGKRLEDAAAVPVGPIIARFTALANKNDVRGWPMCKKCGVEFLRVDFNGLCGECGKPPVIEKPKEKKVSVYEKISEQRDDKDRRSEEARRKEARRFGELDTDA